MKKVSLILLCLLFGGLGFMYAQTQITGTVTSSEDGEPLPGVSVVVEGTTIGTATDIDGGYSISVPEDATVLIYSSVGFGTQNVSINGRSVIDVVMEMDVVGLEEVVVTALGIKRSEKAIGYSSTTVSSEEITKTQATDVMSALSGKVAGVDITSTSSSPGASNAVVIRGMSSLGGTNQPLYVVDGVPIINNAIQSSDNVNGYYDFGSGNQMFNPNDVESVTVLKGAAATALYGNRAANGVVLISTKEGVKGQGLKVTINSSMEMSDILRLPEWQNDFGMGWDGHHTLIENGSWGPELDGTMRLWGTVYNNSQKLKPFEALPDNVADFFDYGLNYQNNVALSGGGENSTFYVSIGQASNDGIAPGDKDSFDKYTATFKGTQEFRRLKISPSVSVSRQNTSFLPTGQGFTVINNLSQIPRDVSIVGMSDYQTDPFDNLDYYFTPYGVINPYYALDNLKAENDAQKIHGKLQFDYEIFTGLTATYRFGIDASEDEREIAFPRLVTTPGTPNYGQVSEPGYVRTRMSRRSEMNHDLFLNYVRNFSGINLDVLVGMNSFDNKYRYVSADIANLDIPDFFDLSNSSESPTTNEYFEQKRMVGVFSNVELSYQDYVFLTLTGRQDYSSTLPKDNNSYFYPGTQLSFVFSELMPSMSNVISLGKVRLAWGRTGKDATPYLLDPYFVAGSNYNPFGNINFPLSQQNAFEVGNRLANANLQPEIRTELEGGLRMGFFQNRLGFDVTLYQSISDKQIFDLGLDYSTGYTSQTTNLGEIENKGVEIMVNVSPVRTSDFDWDINYNFTKNNEELVSLPEELGDKVSLGGLTTISFVAKVGEPLGLFEVSVPQKTAQGEIVVDGDGQPVPAAEKGIIPSANFDYTMGLTNTFRYKNISLSVDFDIRQGGLIYSRTKDISLFTGNLIETTYNDRRPFIVPNSVQAVTDVDGEMDADGSADDDFIENTTPIADDGLVTYWSNGYDKLDEAFLLPRSFTKLKRVVLRYALPGSLINRLPLSGVTVSVFGNNLLLWTPAENHHIDPESSTFGNDLESRYGEFSVYPPTRSFGASLNLTF